MTPPRAISPSSRGVGSALARMLEPALALALESGLKHADVDAIVRSVLVGLAERQLGAGNVSQLSVCTGLNRKEVGRLQRQSKAALALGGSLAAPDFAGASKRSVASQVFLHWVQSLDEHPEWVTLPVAGAVAQGPQSFTQLARAVVSDVHPRALLDELGRLGLVQEIDGEARLLTDGFVPTATHSNADHGAAAADASLALLADNVRSHLAAGVANISQNTPKTLEQSLWGEGLSGEDCLALDAAARAAWATAHSLLYQRLLAAPEAQTGQARHRFRLGMYVHAEPMPTSLPT